MEVRRWSRASRWKLLSSPLLRSSLCLQKVGFFNQQYADQLTMEETATEYLMRNFNLPYQDSRKCLGRFGLESHAHTIQISKLSGRSLQLFERTWDWWRPATQLALLLLSSALCHTEAFLSELKHTDQSGRWFETTNWCSELPDEP